VFVEQMQDCRKEKFDCLFVCKGSKDDCTIRSAELEKLLKTDVSLSSSSDSECSDTSLVKKRSNTNRIPASHGSHSITTYIRQTETINNETSHISNQNSELFIKYNF
jgi:hypothetical protein